MKKKIVIILLSIAVIVGLGFVINSSTNDYGGYESEITNTYEDKIFVRVFMNERTKASKTALKNITKSIVKDKEKQNNYYLSFYAKDDYIENGPTIGTAQQKANQKPQVTSIVSSWKDLPSDAEIQSYFEVLEVYNELGENEQSIKTVSEKIGMSEDEIEKLTQRVAKYIQPEMI